MALTKRNAFETGQELQFLVTLKVPITYLLDRVDDAYFQPTLFYKNRCYLNRPCQNVTSEGQPSKKQTVVCVICGATHWTSKSQPKDGNQKIIKTLAYTNPALQLGSNRLGSCLSKFYVFKHAIMVKELKGQGR